MLQPQPKPPLTTFAAYGHETFTVRAADGTVLRGWIFRGGIRDRWIMLNYGNGGSMLNMTPIADWFVQATNATVVMWDYRGYGFSDGKKSIAATRDDALRVYDAMRKREGSAPIVYGLSFGTTIAVRIAEQRAVSGLILHAAPSSADALFRSIRDRQFPTVLRGLRPLPTADVRADFDVARELTHVRTPLLMLHGASDRLIPNSEGRADYAASAARDKHFVLIPHADHNDVDYAGTPAGRAIAAFTSRRAVRRRTAASHSPG